MTIGVLGIGRTILGPKLMGCGVVCRSQPLVLGSPLLRAQAGLASQSLTGRCVSTLRTSARGDLRRRPGCRRSGLDPLPALPASNLVDSLRWQKALPSLALLPFSLDSLPSFSSLTSPLSDFLLTHPTLGSFSLTIILLTLSLRTFLTLPANLWARARTRRMRRIVAPEMREWNEVLAKKVAGESRRQGLGYDGYKKELKRQLAAQQSILVRKHKCHPFLTAIAPIAVHVPSFILLSLGIRGAVAKAQEREVLMAESLRSVQEDSSLISSEPVDRTSPLDTPALPDLNLDIQLTSPLTHAFSTEPFFLCPTLVDPDPTLIIPFMIGLAVFANVEVMGAWREGLREMREDKGELGVSNASPAERPGPGRKNGSSSSDEVISKGRDWMGRRIVQVKTRTREDIPKFATSSINAPVRGSKSRSKPSSTSSITKPTSPVLQDETDVGNMTMDEIKSRGLRIETATLRERIVGNVLRGFAVVVVGIATEMPVAVAIYWLTSTTYTLVQNWIFGWFDRKEERAIKLAALTAASPNRAKRVL